MLRITPNGAEQHGVRIYSQFLPPRLAESFGA